MTIQTTEAPERQLIYEDAEGITRLNKRIENSIPLYQRIVDVYESIPELPLLDTVAFQAIFNDIGGFCQSKVEQYYKTHFSAAHEPLGISEAIGMTLVADKLPNMAPLIEANQEYFDLMHTNSYGQMYEGTNMFIIDNGIVLANTDAVEACKESAYRFYLETHEEFELRDAIISACNGLKRLDDLLPNYIFDLFNPNPPPNGVPSNSSPDFNRLHDLLLVISDRRFDVNAEPNFKPKVEFFRQFRLAKNR